MIDEPIESRRVDWLRKFRILIFLWRINTQIIVCGLLFLLLVTFFLQLLGLVKQFWYFYFTISQSNGFFWIIKTLVFFWIFFSIDQGWCVGFFLFFRNFFWSWFLRVWFFFYRAFFSNKPPKFLHILLYLFNWR